MPFDRDQLKPKIEELARRNVFVGTSSWKYPGWCSMLYETARYEWSGKFTKSRFEKNCLAEYAEVFKTVCVDAAYYTFPTRQYLEGMVTQVPSDFQFGFKVTDEITLKHFPNLPRFGDKAGKPNENFLNTERFAAEFLQPCQAIRQNVGLLIFEFSRFHQSDYAHGRDFIADLDQFLSKLPKGWPYGVEIRNRQWLQPEYFDCLKKHQVAHVYNSWDAMPPVSEQIALPESQTSPDLLAARFLLKPGRNYADAVKTFEPYNKIKEINEEARKAGSMLIHPKQSTGGQVFPQMQIQMFPRLQRFDVDFDLPEVFLPEFPPAIFLQSRPELGDVSRGEVVSINNYYRLFKDILTPVQLDGLRLLVTPFPQEEFNPTDDRKTAQPSLGVTCFDCHVNGHTAGQFHLNPDIRPQQRRFRLDTTSLRGVFNQQLHSSKRSLRSIEDFTEFEQRTAYFNGDEIHAIKKGMNILDRIQVSHMAQMQNMLDFPPAPKLDTLGKLDHKKATPKEIRGETVFFGKGQCATCHAPPTYLDHQMHDLHMERFLAEPPDGPMKTFTLRGIKDSPPYMHDGRCLTLEDTVEFFNLVLETKLTKEEKSDLVAFMKAL